mgnify:CR=1 FL=1
MEFLNIETNLMFGFNVYCTNCGETIYITTKPSQEMIEEQIGKWETNQLHLIKEHNELFHS